jgi:hypothetical protein
MDQGCEARGIGTDQLFPEEVEPLPDEMLERVAGGSMYSMLLKGVGKKSLQEGFGRLKVTISTIFTYQNWIKKRAEASQNIEKEDGRMFNSRTAEY